MSDHNPLLISVIIPTCHRNDLLAKCLDCLAPGVQTLSPEQYEVIVTDDGSRSTAQQMVQEGYPWAKWTEGPHRGPAANRNHGAKIASGEWLAFTDDDCLPEPGWLFALAGAMNGPEQALEGAIHPVGNLDQDLAECPVNLTGGYFWSANIAIQRTLFQQINGFDPTYLLAAHEDQDIKIRLESKTAIIFVTQAVVLHPVRILSLKKKLVEIPLRTTAWAKHAKKNCSELGYISDSDILATGLKSQIISVGRNLVRRHFKSVIVGLSTIAIGLPVAWFYLRQPRPKGAS